MDQDFYNLCLQYEPQIKQYVWSCKQAVNNQNWHDLYTYGKGMYNLCYQVGVQGNQISDLSQQAKNLKQLWDTWVYHCGKAGYYYQECADDCLHGNFSQGQANNTSANAELAQGEPSIQQFDSQFTDVVRPQPI